MAEKRKFDFAEDDLLNAIKPEQLLATVLEKLTPEAIERMLLIKSIGELAKQKVEAVRKEASSVWNVPKMGQMVIYDPIPERVGRLPKMTVGLRYEIKGFTTEGPAFAVALYDSEKTWTPVSIEDVKPA